MKTRKDVGALMREGTAVDRAVDEAFFEAVRHHRRHKVEMAMWENEQVVLMDPFDIALPEDEAEERPQAAD